MLTAEYDWETLTELGAGEIVEDLKGAADPQR